MEVEKFTFCGSEFEIHAVVPFYGPDGMPSQANILAVIRYVDKPEDHLPECDGNHDVWTVRTLEKKNGEWLIPQAERQAENDSFAGFYEAHLELGKAILMVPGELFNIIRAPQADLN